VPPVPILLRWLGRPRAGKGNSALRRFLGQLRHSRYARWGREQGVKTLQRRLGAPTELSDTSEASRIPSKPGATIHHSQRRARRRRRDDHSPVGVDGSDKLLEDVLERDSCLDGVGGRDVCGGGRGPRSGRPLLSNRFLCTTYAVL